MTSAGSILGVQLMVIWNLYFSSERWRAPQADIFRMPGPLMPQCVMSMGPSLARLELGILTVVWATESPERSVMRESFILNVNRDGTGGASE